MFERQRRFSPRWFGAIGLFFGLLIAAVIAAPKVVEVVPLHESTDVPSMVRISIVFSQSMDVQSVESRFSIEPQEAGALA